MSDMGGGDKRSGDIIMAELKYFADVYSLRACLKSPKS
jgi:hypothetical protein